MQPIIDADTHISESEEMWAMFDKEMYGRRPVLLSLPDNTLYGNWNKTWLIDGNIFPKPAGKGGFRLITPSASKIQSNRKDLTVACRDMTDIPSRLADMDRLGIATQVVYPTLFLVYLTDDPELDVALSRAYNRFIAQACARSNGRIHWVAIPPLRDIAESVKELQWAKQNGAVGVFFRGMEGEYTLDNPRFHPTYQAASDLDLPICVHTGSSTPAISAMFDLERNRQWSHSAFPPLHAFRDLVLNRIPDMFPKLRFGFLEASASWIPFSDSQTETGQYQALENIVEIAAGFVRRLPLLRRLRSRRGFELLDRIRRRRSPDQRFRLRPQRSRRASPTGQADAVA